MPTKTVTKKKVTRKPAKKVVSRPHKAGATLRKEVCTCDEVCRPEHGFWVNNGPVVSSLCELREAIQAMSSEQYLYHTTRNGNDFASWIRDCLGNAVLAERVAHAKTQGEAAHAIARGCAH